VPVRLSKILFEQLVVYKLEGSITCRGQQLGCQRSRCQDYCIQDRGQHTCTVTWSTALRLPKISLPTNFVNKLNESFCILVKDSSEVAEDLVARNIPELEDNLSLVYQ